MVKTIEELAREAGGEWNYYGTQWEFGADEITHFAALVRAQAMEEAAVICEKTLHSDEECARTFDYFADIIRAAAQEVKSCQ